MPHEKRRPYLGKMPERRNEFAEIVNFCYFFCRKLYKQGEILYNTSVTMLFCAYSRLRLN